MGNMRFFLAFGIFGLSLCAMAGTGMLVVQEDGQLKEEKIFEYESVEVDKDGNLMIILEPTAPKPTAPKPAAPKPAAPKPAAPKPAAPNNCPSPPPGLEKKNLPSGRFYLTLQANESHAFRFNGKLKNLAMAWMDVATGSPHTLKEITISPCAGDFNIDRLPIRCYIKNYTATMYLSNNKNVPYACTIDPKRTYWLNIRGVDKKRTREVFETSIN